MGWGKKSANGGDNEEVYSDPSSESQKRPYKPGYYYNGNRTKDAQAVVAEEGSLGLAINQGQIRRSAIPVIGDGDMGQDNKKRIKEQGTHAQWGKIPTKKLSREL